MFSGELEDVLGRSPGVLGACNFSQMCVHVASAPKCSISSILVLAAALKLGQESCPKLNHGGM